jgi:aminopeptidase N
MAQASERDVAAAAASWTDQPGFPLLGVSSVCEGRQTRVTISQRRMRDGATPPAPRNAGAAGALWQIRCGWRGGGEMSTVLLTGAQQPSRCPVCSDASLVANAGGIGFYRVKYDEALGRHARAALRSLGAGRSGHPAQRHVPRSRRPANCR